MQSTEYRAAIDGSKIKCAERGFSLLFDCRTVKDGKDE